MERLNVETLLWYLYECKRRGSKEVSIEDIILLEDARYGVGCRKFWCENGEVWCSEYNRKMDIKVKLRGLSDEGAKWVCEWYDENIKKS